MANSNTKHPGYRKVGYWMREYTELYFGDARCLAHLSTDEIFAFVENIPYAYDREIWGPGNEGIVRPARFKELPGLDCKKKAILVACWARCNQKGYRFIAVDDTGHGVSHVFCEIEEAPGFWVSMDCTIPGLFKPGSPMPNVKFAEVI